MQGVHHGDLAHGGSIAVKTHALRVPHVCMLTDPAMGGMSEGFAFLGDMVHRTASPASNAAQRTR